MHIYRACLDERLRNISGPVSSFSGLGHRFPTSRPESTYLDELRGLGHERNKPIYTQVILMKICEKDLEI